MIWLLLIAALALLVFLPQWWVKRVLKRYETPANRYPGTGGELARHLLNQLGLEAVSVERLEGKSMGMGDHYDPSARAIRLSPSHFDGASLTAVTVAAHEVGHAIQHADGYQPLLWRTKLVGWMQKLQKLGLVLVALMPVFLLVLRLPSAGLILLMMGLAALASGVIVHLMTLPTELDASFRRALPLLKKGRYLKPEDERHARKILTAASLTYVAASLLGLVNFWWWLRVLRLP